MNLCKHSSAMCGHDPECPDIQCPGRPLPLHRQVMPPEPKEQDGYQSGLWMVYTAAALILLAFCFMTWLAYPNLPQ